MNSIRLAAALAGAVGLGGCYPVHDAVYAPVALSPAAQFETMYGRAAPVSIRSAGQSSIASGARGALAPEALIYSKEWRKREDEREAKLKQSSTVCRC